MGLHKTLADDIEEVDVIIAGGGTAGCIVASRLADADPNLSILVIERGPDNYNDPTVVTPAFFMQHLLPTSKTALFYKSNKVEQLAGREVIVTTGGMLGGGSSINWMMYSRGQRSDFDLWQTDGWYADDLIPYMKKLETYHGPGRKELHGHDGPIHISGSTYRSEKPESDCIRAAAKMGIPENKDLQDLESYHGVQRWLRFVSPDGKRQDTAHGYLHPKLMDGNHPNLHVVVESQVHRVLIEGKRAVGVEYRQNPAFQASGNLSETSIRSVKAKKMVIVSCGACGTPPVLERSGIGSPEILGRSSIPVVEDLPGVGDGYEDHHLVVHPYNSSLEPYETLDAFLSGRYNAATLIETKDKILGWNAVDIASKLRPTEEEVSAFGPEVQQAWNRDYKEVPDRPLMLMALVSSFMGDPAAVPEGQYLTIGSYTPYPYSRGHIHITGPSLDDPVDFNVGFLTDVNEIDLKIQVWAYKKLREIMRRMQTYRGELALGHPRFPEGSKAACIETNEPLPDNVSDIVYTAEDDAAIEQWVRENLGTTWHSIGTCKMAPRDKKGVVDQNLSVYGVEGLKIADLSIPPGNVAANTSNTAMVVGEKAAAIFIKELGLSA